MAIPKDFIADLIARTDIVDLISARVPLKKKGHNYAACCPFHQEKTPSFSVSQPKQFYHCFGCGAHGNAIGFLMAHDRLTFPEAVESLATQLGLSIPQTDASPSQQPKIPAGHYDLLQKATHYYQAALERAQPARAYLTKRGLTPEILTHFNIGFAPPGWHNLHHALGRTAQQAATLLETGLLIKNAQQNLYDRFRDRIMVPIKDSHGRIIGFGGRTLGDEQPKYLNSPETPLFHKGKELYGFYEARQAHAALERAIIVEGYMDVIALHQAGITQAVATLGTAMSETHLQSLLRHTENIIICFDGDIAGKNAAWRALEISMPVIRDGIQIQFMFLPEGEDPDSFVRTQGREVFEQQLDSAITLPDFFFDTLCKQVKLGTVEGKAKLNQLAHPLLNKMRPGIFQRLMFERLSTLLGVSVDAATPSQTTTPIRNTQRQRPTKTKLLSPIQRAIALLLQYPHLAEDPTLQLPDGLAQLKQPGASVLIKMFALLKRTSTLTTGAILEHWRDARVYHRLAELAVYELPAPRAGLDAELRDALLKISQLGREDQIQQLLNKANQTQLTPEEKVQLMTLLKARDR